MSFVRLLCSAMILSASYPVWKAVAEPALRDASAPQIAAVSGNLPVELVPTGSSHIVEVTVSHEQDEVVPSDEQLKDSPDGLHLMSPITVSGSVNDWASAGREEAQLPEAEPLEASSVPAVEIKMARLEVDDLISIGSGGLSIEKVMREPLLSSLRVEPIEPIELEFTEISGQILVDPLTLIISLKDQRLDVYRGLKRVETTRISSGKRGYETLTGVFGILQKKKEHYSNLYDSAPMPWMQRLTRSGTALHAGAVPNRPASHGCVRLPQSFAPKIYGMTEIGGKVAMLTGSMVEPKRIESSTLVMPVSQTDPGTTRIVASVDAGLREGAKAAVLSSKTKLANAIDAEADAEDKAHWHILVTRREKRDIAIGSQEALAAMGYLKPEDKFVGYLGNGTKKAIRAFEKDHGLRPRGLFTEEVAAKIYQAAGKGPLPDAYLFLRKGLSRARHVPVQLREAKKPLGTHLFTYVHPSDGSEPGWVGFSLEGEDSKSVLDRITIPENMRDQISMGLTPGASLIVADVAKHSSVLPEGDDFIVRTNDSAASNVVAEKAKAERRRTARRTRAAKPKRRTVQARPKQRTVQARPKQRKATFKRRASGKRGFGLFRRP